MAAPGNEALIGHWVHSHEDDGDGEMVFRPATYPFPPARGRVSFELRRDGTYVESSPGPVDLPVQSAGGWSCDGGRLILGAEGDATGHAWDIVKAEADRLVVKR